MKKTPGDTIVSITKKIAAAEEQMRGLAELIRVERGRRNDLFLNFCALSRQLVNIREELDRMLREELDRMQVMLAPNGYTPHRDVEEVIEFWPEDGETIDAVRTQIASALRSDQIVVVHAAEKSARQRVKGQIAREHSEQIRAARK
jgi:hypothetical protein